MDCFINRHFEAFGEILDLYMPKVRKTKTGFMWNIASGILQLAIGLSHKVHDAAMLVELFVVMILDHRGKRRQEDSWDGVSLEGDKTIGVLGNNSSLLG